MDPLLPTHYNAKVAPTLILSAIICLCASCHNRPDTGDVSKAQQDSIRRADSINSAADHLQERNMYVTNMHKYIDSIQMRINYNDSVYATSNTEKWHEGRARMNARLDRLKQRADSAKSVTNQNWDKFKMQVDTAEINLKRDWNIMLENMKAR